MKYNLNINQYAAIKLGLDIDVYDLIVYDFIRSFSLSPKCVRLQEHGHTWFWISHSIIIKEVPLLRRWSKKNEAFEPWKEDTVYTRFKSLISAGLLIGNPSNKGHRRTYIRFGEICDKYEFSEENLRPEENRVDQIQIGSRPDTNLEDNNKYNNSLFIKGEIEINPDVVSGYGLEIQKADFPLGFEHPDIIDPKTITWELFEKLYGSTIPRSQKTEVKMAQATHSLPDIYKHAFILVAVTEKKFRSNIFSYISFEKYKEDIIDRRSDHNKSNSGGTGIQYKIS